MTAVERRFAAPSTEDDRVAGVGPPPDLVAALLRLDQIMVARLGALAPEPARAFPHGALVAVDTAWDVGGLAAAFGLSPVEVDVVVLAAAPELDSWYGRAMGLLQDDLTRRRPTVGCAVDLLSGTGGRLVAPSLLGPRAPLVRHGLVRVEAAAVDGNAPFPDRELVVDEAVVGHLLGAAWRDNRLLGLARTTEDGPALEDLVLEPGVWAPLADLAAAKPAGLVELRGPEGSGREAVALALARAWGVPRLVGVDVGRLPWDDPASIDDLTMRVIRDARLVGAATYWQGADAVLADGRAAVRERWLARLVDEPFAFLACGDAGSAGAWPVAAALTLTRPGPHGRARLWAGALSARGATTAPERLAPLAAAFRFGPGAIAEAVGLAARSAGGRCDRLTPADLAAAGRQLARRRFEGHAERVPDVAGWDDLVLPPDRLDQLRALVDHVRHRGVVHDEWGVDRAGIGRGVCAMLVGPSGTGKTMAAGVVAAEIGLDLYRVDLARVVSKYIGETEKNLSRIFAAADAADALLFFDEADALFGKRSEVRDAHDRYANLEVSYLLQRIEAHGGVVVLATNLRKNIDDAFLRRLQHVVELPMPDAPHRRRLWERAWPAAAPVDPALDRAALADRFELSGGSIRNVAVAAAVAAAAAGSSITEAHVLAALRHEHRKLGRVAGGALFTTPLANGTVPTGGPR